MVQLNNNYIKETDQINLLEENNDIPKSNELEENKKEKN